MGCGHWDPAGLPPELKTYLDCRQTGEKKSGRYGYILNLWSGIAQLHRRCRFFTHISVLHVTGFVKKGHILYFNKIFQVWHFQTVIFPQLFMTKKTKQFMVQYKYPRQVMPLHTRNLEPSPLPPRIPSPLPPRIRVFAVVLFPENSQRLKNTMSSKPVMVRS